MKHLHWPTLLFTLSLMTLATAFCFLLWPEAVYSAQRYALLRSTFSASGWGLVGAALSLTGLLRQVPGRILSFLTFPGLTLYWTLLSLNYLLASGLAPMALVAVTMTFLTGWTYYLSGGFRTPRIR